MKYITIPSTIDEERFHWIPNTDWDASVQRKTYFFLSGLPRSGTTLLGAILEQNPDIYVGPTSPVLDFLISFDNVFNPNRNLFQAFPKEDFRVRTLSRIPDDWYSDVDSSIIIDKNRGWPRCIPYVKLFTDNIKIHSKNYNLDANLLLALIREESLFDPHAVSRVGAKGLMQLMDYTGEKIKRDLNLDSNSNFFDPELNIQIGTYYLASLIKEFDNNIFLALAAYNGGPKNVKKWLIRFDNLEDDEFVESIPFKETHGYVKRVLRSYFYYALDS